MLLFLCALLFDVGQEKWKKLNRIPTAERCQRHQNLIVALKPTF